jgi:P27 family predicted phage terminase small subunit
MSAESHLNPLPSVDDGIAGAVPPAVAALLSEIPDQITKLNVKEKKIWQHVTQALHEYGLIHRTDAMMLTIICRTFVNWVEAEDELARFRRDNGGSHIKETANGYRAPDPTYYMARDYKKQLLSWLPEAALTIPSFHKIKGEDAAGGQGALPFDDPIERFRSQKAAIGMRIVGKK